MKSDLPIAGHGNKKALLGVLLLFPLLSGQTWLDPQARKNAEGNEFYKQKEYSRALEKYVEAQDGRRHQQELSYNLANTLYQQKKYAEAIKELDKAAALGDSGLKPSIFYNKGNALFQTGKYADAVESYKQALALNPKDREAKHNLELALKKMQENPQQQKSQNKQNQSSEKEQSENKKEDQSQQGHNKNDSSQPQKKEGQQNRQEGHPQPENEQASQPKPSQTSHEQAGKMDPKQALQILDALNQQEKKEQRNQALKVQRIGIKGKDW
ncbi:MAG: tetratricopeptide repeat protein [Terriglobia bacterium]